MATMTQADAIQQYKRRIQQLKAENADLRNENDELNEAISSIYDISAGFSLVGEEDLDEEN